MKVKLIHPKTKVVKELDESEALMLRLLKRAGFVLAKGYKAPVAKAPEPSLAEIVEGQSEKMEVAGVEVAAEMAIHVPVIEATKPLSEMGMKELRALAKDRGIKIPFGVNSRVGVAGYLEEAE